MHRGQIRKFNNLPYIIHPLEVAQILAGMTDDQEIIAAGILHDTLEETDASFESLKRRFGSRIAELVNAETEQKTGEMSKAESWKKRKEESLARLKNSQDIGVKMLWLADKLSNIRSLAAVYSERGDEIWKELNQSDPAEQCWYYRTIAEYVELTLNKTGVFKEFVRNINYIWPDTFDSAKTRYRKYKEISLEGCSLIGHGAKGDVYRYNDELIIKVYNENNTYKDVEEEIEKSRKAFILGLPTAISFGIVSVGDRYGAMFELLDCSSLSKMIAMTPSRVDYYAKKMAALAHLIHHTEVSAETAGQLPDIRESLHEWVQTGIANVDKALSEKCTDLIDAIPETHHLIHGDFHSGNVLWQQGTLLMIDLDRLSTGWPIAEICGLYMTYVALGERDPSVIENFMGFSYGTSKEFYRCFMEHYLDTKDEKRIREVNEKAELLCCIRMIHKLWRKGTLAVNDEEESARLTERLKVLLGRVGSLMI